MKKILSLFLIISFLSSFTMQNLSAFLPKVEAQNYASPCINLSYNLTIGSRDHQSEGQVSQLQAYLISTGFMNYPNPTGYFGPVTRASVAKYQTQNQIYPNVGYVGPLTRASINSQTCSQYIPSTPSQNLTYYCDLDGINYGNEQDYLDNCQKTIIHYTYICQSNGQTYTSRTAYDQNCNNSNNQNNQKFYCSLNGQTYWNLEDYQNNCRNVSYPTPNSGSLPICNLGTVYNAANVCECPTNYSFNRVGNGYQCDNGHFACTMIYVAPWQTSPNYDRCHYANYCVYDGLYHNDASYCKPIPPNSNYCLLNKVYQGGGIIATNDCVCPSNSYKLNTERTGEIYKWICKPIMTTY